MPNQRQFPFVKMAEFILQDQRIEPISRLVYLQLIIDARSYGVVVPRAGYEEIAAQLSVKTSQIRKALKDLEDAGFVTIRRHQFGFDITLTPTKDVFNALVRLASI
jgi:Mn-dependent DtxR family transcriptional regulator